MKDIEKRLEECGVYLKGHFVLDSFLHADEYVEKANIYKDPILTDDLCWDIAQQILLHYHTCNNRQIEVVVGPAIGGIILSNRVACHLSDLYQVKVTSLFTEKDEEDKQVLKRGYLTDIPGRNVLVVDDVLTTGHQIREIIEEVKNNKGNVVGIGVIYDRRDSSSETLHLLLIALLKRRMKIWKRAECPLCKEKVLIDEWVGRGMEFLNSHPDYPR
jgi:orotate phosphoribosyltransferase